MLPSYFSLLLENRRLRRQLFEKRREGSPPLFDFDAYSAKNYAVFLLGRLRRRVIYRAWRRVWNAFRPTLFLYRALRVAMITYAVLQASAAAIVLSALLVVILPPLSLVSAAILLAGTRESRRAERRLSPLFSDAPALFLFVDGRISSPYRALAEEYRGRVFFVSSSFRRLVGRRTRFFSAYCEFCGGYLITPRCYFRLRRHFKNAPSVTLVF